MINAKKVEEIFINCLFKDEEIKDSEHIKSMGIHAYVGFNPERLNLHKQTIIEFLEELPDKYRESCDGGWTFLESYIDKHGNSWTDNQKRMDQLFMLGQAIGKIKYSDRKVWKALPGNMPYITYLDK